MARLLPLLVLVILATTAQAAEPSRCDKNDALQIEKHLSSTRTWNALYEDFRTYKQCAYGSGWLAELYSDVIVKLLADDWGNFQRLVDLTLHDDSFKTFVLEHIDLTADIGDLRKAVQNLQHHCPKDDTTLCVALEKRISGLLTEYSNDKQ